MVTDSGFKSDENAPKMCEKCGTPYVSPYILRLKPENINTFISVKIAKPLNMNYSEAERRLSGYM